MNYRKDGTLFWNELSITPVFDADDQLTQFVAVMRDVTECRQAEAQGLLAAQVFEQSSEGFIITDAQGRIIKVNKAFSVITGFSESEVLGRNRACSARAATTRFLRRHVARHPSHRPLAVARYGTAARRTVSSRSGCAASRP